MEESKNEKFVKNIRVGKGEARKLVSFLMLALCFLPIKEMEARQYFGLKVHGDFRTLEPIVSDIPLNRSGVTKEDVLNRVRQKLWESGIKPDRPRYNSHFLEVDLIIHSRSTNFSVEVSLKKMAQAYGYDPRKVGRVIELPKESMECLAMHIETKVMSLMRWKRFWRSLLPV